LVSKAAQNNLPGGLSSKYNNIYGTVLNSNKTLFLERVSIVNKTLCVELVQLANKTLFVELL
jgi:hypothetical protein